MEEKSFQEIYEQIEIPQEDLHHTIRNGIQRAEQTRGKKRRHGFSNLVLVSPDFWDLFHYIQCFIPIICLKLPLLGSVFELFAEDEESTYQEYNQNAVELGMMKESNGVTPTMTEGVYDGENIILAFLLSSEEDLGKVPFIEWDMDPFVNEHLSRNNLLGGSQIIEKLDANTYAGLLVFNLSGQSPSETIHFRWVGHRIFDKWMSQNKCQGNGHLN